LPQPGFEGVDSGAKEKEVKRMKSDKNEFGKQHLQNSVPETENPKTQDAKPKTRDTEPETFELGGPNFHFCVPCRVFGVRFRESIFIVSEGVRRRFKNCREEKYIMGKVWKRSAPATTEKQRFNCSNLPVDPLKLEPPFQLPRPDWPLQSKKRKTQRKYKTDKAEKKRPLMDARKALLALLLTKIESSQKENRKADPQNREEAEISRVLGSGKIHGSNYMKLLEKAVSQDSTIQRVLPIVVAAATDINISDNERNEAAKAIISFTILHRDDYNAVRSSCEDNSDKQSEALADLIYFYERVDESISQFACEAYSRLAEIDRLEKKLEKKKDEMKELGKDQNRAMIATAIGSLATAPIIELITPGLVAAILPFYVVYLGVVGMIGLRMKNKISLRNLSEQKWLEAEQEEKKRELDCLALPEPATI